MGDLHFLISKNCLLIKRIQYQLSAGHRDQCHREVSPEVDTHNYGQVFDKGAKAVTIEKGQAFPQIALEHLGNHMQGKVSIELHFTIYLKISSELIIDVHIEHKTVAHLEKNTEENLHSQGVELLDLTTKARP